MQAERLAQQSEIDKINEEYKLALQNNEYKYSNDVKLYEGDFDQACHDANATYEKSEKLNALN